VGMIALKHAFPEGPTVSIHDHVSRSAPRESIRDSMRRSVCEVQVSDIRIRQSQRPALLS